MMTESLPMAHSQNQHAWVINQWKEVVIPHLENKGLFGEKNGL